MSQKPAVVIFFNDWVVHPGGVNAGGGESATMALGRAIRALGYRVIACANLPDGEVSVDGIEFWNFGADYALHTVTERLQEIGDYYCIAATLAHPFLFVRSHANCLARILINHSPGVASSGIETATVVRMIDYMLCVSDTQRSILLSHKVSGDKIKVVKNGFDPEIFTYAGPEGRDWDQLVFIGRVEAPKGVHVLIQVFGELKIEFPDLKLSIFGDESYWPEFTSHKQDLMRKLPGLQFHGKVPQVELAGHLRKAGLLVFPSQTFETAGLAIVDAQASGCPVVANGVGGVPEYVVEKQLGELVHDKNPKALREAIAKLLRDRPRLMRMSEAAKTLGRKRPWQVVAQEVLSWAEKAATARRPLPLEILPKSILRIKHFESTPVADILAAHETVAHETEFSATQLLEARRFREDDAWPYLIEGVRLESSGEIELAIEAYHQAAERSITGDWQAFFRLALLHAERRELPLARKYAEKVIEQYPKFLYRAELEQLIASTKM